MRFIGRPVLDGLPLIDRPLASVVFHRPGGAVTAGAFLGAAARLAASLPERRMAALCCTERLAFALAFAATMMRGQVAVLADRTPGDADPLGDLDVDADRRLDGPPWEGPPPLIGADQVVAEVATSGSTGLPVSHEKRFGALVQRSRAAGERFGFQEAAPAAIVGTVPPRHMYGFETTVLLPLHAACASWCGAAFYPSDVRAALASVPGPRVLVSTPLQLRAFLQAADGWATLAAVVSATAPIDAALAEAVERRWDTALYEIFGATELGSVASRRTVAGEMWEAYPGVELVAEGDGVAVRAAHAVPARLDDAIDWAGGPRFRLIGRHTDMVKLAGRRASLAGLNRILNAVPGVDDGAFLAPDERDSRPTARMLAFVVAPDRSAGEILGALRGRIDPVFLPRRIFKLDRLPRNEIGKLPRQALADLANA